MITRSILLRSGCFLTLGLLVALPDLAEARGAGRGGRSGGGRAASAGRPAGGFSGGAPGGFTAGVPQPRQVGPRQARPTPAAPRPGSFPTSSLPTNRLPSALPTTRDVQSLLGQGPPQAAQAQALQAGNFSPEQAAAKFDSATASANAQSAVSDFQNGPEPLSPAWYAEHPTAWQATHPHADTVAVASAAAVTSWIAYGNYPATSTVIYDDSSTTIVYEEAAITTAAEPQPVYAAPVPTETAPVEPATGEWLNLGVYEVKTTPDAAATQRHQLSVNRDGTLKGVYHDQLTGAAEGLSGRIDSATQQATWWLDINPAVTFTTSLDSLTATTGSVTLTLPTGEQVLTISREEAL